MKKLLWYQAKSIIVYLFGVFFFLGIFLFAEYCLNVIIPIKVIGILVMLCPLVSACIRVHTWKKRKQLLSSEVLNTIGAAIYFLTAPVELLFSVVGMWIMVV